MDFDPAITRVFALMAVLATAPALSDTTNAPRIAQIEAPAKSESVPTEEAEASPSDPDVPAVDSIDPDSADHADLSSPTAVEPPASPPTVDERWTARVDELENGLLTGETTPDVADAMCEELSQLLVDHRRRLGLALTAARRGRDFDEAQTLHGTFTSLYRLRLRLLEHLSPEYRSAVLGAGYRGVVELTRELAHVGLELRYQRTVVPRLAVQWLDRLRRAPLPALRGLLELVLILVLFRLWRGWAVRGLPQWRESLVEAGTRTPGKLRLARLVWYVDQVRRPLEWLFLAEVLFSALDLSLIEGAVERVSAVLRWILLAWFLVRLIHTASARGKVGLSGKDARLRLRSLRTLAGWFVLLGLGLDLAESYAGQGTLYAWVWMAFRVLTVPLAILLVVWWRAVIFQRLEREPRERQWVQRLLERRKGIRGYARAAVGGVYLFGVQIVQIVMRILALNDWGKDLQSHWYRLGIARAAARRATAEDAAPLPDEIRARLLDGSGNVIEKVGRTAIRRVADLAECGTGGLVVVIADRGFGKSVLLRRLSSVLDRKTLAVECPPGGLAPLLRAFGRELGLKESGASTESVVNALEKGDYGVVTIDNYHRLARPVMGGLAEMEKIAEIIRNAPQGILWAVTMNQAAWRYISCARGSSIALDEILELPAWTEQQIAELIKMRCRAVGIDPDFERIVLPRQLDDGDFASVAERNRAGVYRLIWDISGGSPAIAIRLWADSLGLAPGGRIFVRLPDLPRIRELETIRISFLLILRVIMQCELATLDDIMESLRLSVGDVGSALRFMINRDWIGLDDGRYRINDAWYGTVIRVLNRRNLISAREGVGVI